MTMAVSFDEQRAVLRLLLQTQRQIFADQLSEKFPEKLWPVVDSETTFPRSFTMRLLTQRTNISLLIATELLPQFIRHFLGGAR
jgi:hypothetical protein